MRNVFSKALLLTVAVVAGSLSAMAKETITCRDFAQAAADDWALGFMDRASDTTVANEDEIVVISYGHKYIMPRQGTIDGDLRPISIGSRIQQRHRVYHEEFVRCLHAKSINLTFDDTSANN